MWVNIWNNHIRKLRTKIRYDDDPPVKDIKLSSWSGWNPTQAWNQFSPRSTWGQFSFLLLLLLLLLHNFNSVSLHLHISTVFTTITTTILLFQPPPPKFDCFHHHHSHHLRSPPPLGADENNRIGRGGDENSRIGWNKLIADWAQKTQCLKICAQSEARTQMGSWTSPLKVSSQGLFQPDL